MSLLNPRSLRGTPALLVTGIDEVATASATMSLAWDLPDAVVVRHRIEVESGRLHRTVSDRTGILERDEIDLEHACVTCAIREEVVPTLRRLAALERWGAIVAHLPLAAGAEQVCRVLHHDRDGDVRVAGVVTALEGESLVETLTGDALLVESGRHAFDGDRRGVAETVGGLVEYADVLMVGGAAPQEGVDLLRALARPDAPVLREGGSIAPWRLLFGLHDHGRTDTWAAPDRDAECPRLQGSAASTVWRLDLRSDRPFHPERLHERLADIGGGPHRSRGCFWLPTRPGQLCAWDGAGGQVSVGTAWARRGPIVQTRLVITGLRSLTDDATIERIREAFEACLLTDAELSSRGRVWECAQDGFEPWLGEVRSSAA